MNLTLSAATRMQMSDGIILLDRSGQPREANAAAQPWLRRCVQLTPKWARHAAREQAGSEALPASVDIDPGEDGSPGAHVHLFKNGQNGYALLIRPPKAVDPRFQKPPKSVFLSLLGSRVRSEIAGFNALVNECRDSGVPGTALMEHAGRLDTLLAEVGKLAELDQRDEVFADERLAVPELVRAILQELPQASGDDALRYVLTEIGEKPAPVYGSRKWLQEALHSLLARLGNDCPEHGRVAIDLRQNGDFLVLNGRVTTDSAGWCSVPGDAALPVEILRAETCRRIIELHGGQLKIRFVNKETKNEEQEAGGAIESITLTLPTGVPTGDRSRVSCAECRVTQQAMQYARDLAELMAGGATANNLSKVNPP